MRPNREGIELPYDEAELVFAVLCTANQDKQELADITSAANSGMSYLGLSAPDIILARREELEAWRTEKIESAKRAGREPSRFVLEYRYNDEDNELNQQYIIKALSYFEAAGLRVEVDPTKVSIPWIKAAQYGRACLNVLQDPGEAIHWIDPACGGFTSPEAQRMSYELIGQISGVIAAAQGFESYHDPNPYTYLRAGL